MSSTSLSGQVQPHAEVCSQISCSILTALGSTESGTSGNASMSIPFLYATEGRVSYRSLVSVPQSPSETP